MKYIFFTLTLHRHFIRSEETETASTNAAFFKDAYFFEVNETEVGHEQDSYYMDSYYYDDELLDMEHTRGRRMKKQQKDELWEQSLEGNDILSLLSKFLKKLNQNEHKFKSLQGSVKQVRSHF